MAVDLQKVIDAAKDAAKFVESDGFIERSIHNFPKAFADIVAQQAAEDVGAIEGGSVGAEAVASTGSIAEAMASTSILGALIVSDYMLSQWTSANLFRPSTPAQTTRTIAQLHQQFYQHMGNAVPSAFANTVHFGKNLAKASSKYVSILGLPSTSTRGQYPSAQHAPFARLPYDVNSIANRLSLGLQKLAKETKTDVASMQKQLAQVWKWIHYTLKQYEHLQREVNVQTKQITQLEHAVKQQAKHIAKLEHEVKHLNKQLTKEIHITKEHTKRIGHHTYRLNHSEDLLTAVAMGFTALSLLSPLVATGEEGVATLTELASDPCRCFKIPGSDAWLLKMAVAFLYWDNE